MYMYKILNSKGTTYKEVGGGRGHLEGGILRSGSKKARKSGKIKQLRLMSDEVMAIPK